MREESIFNFKSNFTSIREKKKLKQKIFTIRQPVVENRTLYIINVCYIENLHMIVRFTLIYTNKNEHNFYEFADLGLVYVMVSISCQLEWTQN